MATEEKSYPAKVAWAGLTIVYLGLLSAGSVFHFFPPVLPQVVAELGITHREAGLMMSLFALPGLFLSLPGGWLVDRFGERAIGGTGLVILGAATVAVGLAGSFPWMLAARTVAGVGLMMTVISHQRLVTRFFEGRPLGLPLGLTGSALPVGISIVLATAGPVAAAHGWREMVLRVGWGTLAAAGVFNVGIRWLTRGQSLGRDPGASKPDGPDPAAAGLKIIWIAGVVWLCANGAMTAFMTYAPDHYRELGLGVTARGLVTSVPMWVSAALGTVTGWLSDRHGGKPAFIVAGMVLMTAGLLAVPLVPAAPVLLGIVLGLALALMVTPLVSLPGSVLPPSHVGRGFGILSSCASLGIVLVPPLAGWARDLSGQYMWTFLGTALVAGLGLVAAEVLRRARPTPGFSWHR